MLPTVEHSEPFVENLGQSTKPGLARSNGLDHARTPGVGFHSILYQLRSTDELLCQLPRASVEVLYDEYLTWADDMAPFWDAYRPWLAARGYKLYEFRYYGTIPYYDPPLHTTPAPLPYAVRYSDDVPTDKPLAPNVSSAPYILIPVYIDTLGKNCGSTRRSWSRCHDQVSRRRIQRTSYSPRFAPLWRAI